MVRCNVQHVKFYTLVRNTGNYLHVKFYRLYAIGYLIYMYIHVITCKQYGHIFKDIVNA